MRKLRLPETLAFAVLVTGAIAATSCNDTVVADAGPDAYPVCTYYCIPRTFLDDGGPGTECPICADPATGACPAGCEPVG